MDMDGFDEDEFPWDMPAPPETDFRRARYADAYGDYWGGYGPGGGFVPRSLGPRPPMPPPMMGSPYPGGSFMGPMRGRGYGPRGPPRKNAGVTHLLSCGLTKESLKNLPNDLLMLMEPRHCGLCGISFDSFNMSRMHYISKNHAKHVKKMLLKAPTGTSKEMPLKSRELYCELCDIEITSKVHGDAHYEGKPHRGIVEGRKRPKNPLLLQPEMQGRLDQLIRREKRALKAAPAAETTVKEPPKPGPPELYCGICKTTVTCSEQMTIHMNGKKHLAKEKHHILMMMKGGTNKDENKDYDNAEGEEENGNGDGEGDGETQAGGEGAGANDDWGNEAWEENKDQTESTAA